MDSFRIAGHGSVSRRSVNPPERERNAVRCSKLRRGARRLAKLICCCTRTPTTDQDASSIDHNISGQASRLRTEAQNGSISIGSTIVSSLPEMDVANGSNMEVNEDQLQPPIISERNENDGFQCSDNSDLSNVLVSDFDEAKGQEKCCSNLSISLTTVSSLSQCDFDDLISESDVIVSDSDDDLPIPCSNLRDHDSNCNKREIEDTIRENDDLSNIEDTSFNEASRRLTSLSQWDIDDLISESDSDSDNEDLPITSCNERGQGLPSDSDCAEEKLEESARCQNDLPMVVPFVCGEAVLPEPQIAEHVFISEDSDRDEGGQNTSSDISENLESVTESDAESEGSHREELSSLSSLLKATTASIQPLTTCQSRERDGTAEMTEELTTFDTDTCSSVSSSLLVLEDCNASRSERELVRREGASAERSDSDVESLPPSNLSYSDCLVATNISVCVGEDAPDTTANSHTGTDQDTRDATTLQSILDDGYYCISCEDKTALQSIITRMRTGSVETSDLVGAVGVQPVFSAEECEVLTSIVEDGGRDISPEDREVIQQMMSETQNIPG